jgi:hypothetical protein
MNALGQEQRERPQDKKPPSLDDGTPPMDQVEIEPVDEILAELEKLKKEEHQRCGCWGS